MSEQSDLADAGIDAARIQRVTEKIREDIGKNRYDGMAIIVARHGNIFLEAHEGYADRSSDIALAPDSVFSLMSLSKGFTTVLALRLIEDGHFSFTTPISSAIPEFQGAKARINVYHILTQTSGLPMYTPDATAEQVADLETYVASILNYEPTVVPGERVAYSVRVAHSVLGLFMQRLMGESFISLVERYVTGPLGLKDTAFGPRQDLQSRLVPVVPASYLADSERDAVRQNVDFINDFSLREGAVVPGSNAFSTARDIHVLTEALRTGRAPDGSMFLSPATLDLVSRTQTGEMPNDLFPDMLAGRNLVDDYPSNLALGFWGRGPTMSQSLFGLLSSPRTFGMVGRGSTVFWVDPVADITVVALSVGLMNEADNLMRFTALGDLIVSSVSDPRGRERFSTTVFN